MSMQATPTIDTNAELRAPTWREERTIPILPSTIDIRATVPRPLTHSVDHQMRGRSINAMAVKQGNINPAMAGVGDESSVWAMSKSMLPGMGAEEAATAKGGTLLTLAVGAGIGYVLWKLSQGGLARL